ncbi:tyrosine-type recombinase/integrase [Pseudoalteromonas sp. T1lg88]|uniref:tyrosine-type recombinase/integrase n=1 Tax=Pseudoalteromonas sp. T1lg88 TaxID=2077104 RepID=UPI000CF69E76|nr:tyrosine-type recombinase/integrase [Pseudoalteromonas sp. T1lg88]
MLIKPTPSDINACCAYYIELCRTKGQSENTVQGKVVCLGYFQTWCVQNNITNLLDITVDVLESYQQSLSEHRKYNSDEHLSRGTCRFRLTVVKVFLRWMFNKEVIPDNGFEKFELPRLGRRLPKPVLSQNEVQQVLDQCTVYGLRGIRDRAIMEVYYAAGIRRAELGSLSLSDIDFGQQQLRINQGKGFKDRYVPVAKRALQWVYQYICDVRPKFATMESGDTLFLANNGKPFRPNQLSELVSKYIKLADVGKTGSCNQYRHAAATHMVDNGADIRHVQEFLGHADLSTTQVYVHVSMAKLQEVYRKTHPAAQLK